MFGEAPGRQESISGRPFCGDSGLELDRLLTRASHLSRRTIYISNVFKFRPSEDNDDPTPKQIKDNEPELQTELQLVNPRLIVSVGKISTAWFLDKPREEVDMEKLHGLVHKTPRLPNALLLPVFHPAAGIHQPERYQHLLYYDFEQVGKAVRGEIEILQDAYSNPIYREITHYSDDHDVVAVDTEGVIGREWGLSITGREGEGYVVRAPNVKTGATIADKRVICHNLLWDLPILRAMGSKLPPIERLEDSMLLAYVMPWLPRGLKALAYRLCGMEMEDYEDVIKEAEARVCKEYFERVLAAKCRECAGRGEVDEPYKRNPNKFKRVKCSSCAGDTTDWPKPVPQLLFNDDGTPRIYKPQSVGRRVRTALERGTNLRESWQSVDDAVRSNVESKLGRLREADLDDVRPASAAINYSARDSDATLRVYRRLHRLAESEGLIPLYELDKSIIPIVDRMHSNGILIDRSHFARLNKLFTAELVEIKDKLCTLVGREFNPSSPKQVGDILYGMFKLKPPKRDAGTDEKTLENLKLKYRNDERVGTFVNLELEFRELDKLKGTYVEPLPAWADKNDRVHTRFLLHVTTSGRLSSRDPNLQNIPTRTERGKLIRQGFIAEEGCTLLSVDLDQIELRVGAHLSEDENMIDIFTSGKDIHRATASLIYRKPFAEITDQERLLSKTINFGVFYGMSPRRLQNELALMGLFYSLDDCVGFINDWFKAYPGIRTYMERCHNEARTKGYVECLFGRRRYLPGVYSSLNKVREESLRWAVNHPDQGTAAGILKRWMSAVWTILPELQRRGRVEPLLTIHDELIFSVKKEIAPLVQAEIIEEASSTMKLLVPIKAKGKEAQNWAELK